MTKKILTIAFAVILVGLAASLPAPAAAAPAAGPDQAPLISAYEVIAEINAYRQANGFAPLSLNWTLQESAQLHSDYQASIEQQTHYGADGSRPRDRVAALGYGGGGPFFISEIIYGGWHTTPTSAMAWWKTSALHNSVMLDGRYREIGAGITTNGEFTYITVELAWVGNFIVYDGVGGDSDGTIGTLPGPYDTEAAAESGEIVIAAAPVVQAEPNADGSIIHVVEYGQTLWTIAAVYGVDLQTLFDLNGMDGNSFVFPGDEIIVQAATGSADPQPVSEEATEAPAEAQPPPPGGEAQIGEAFSYVPPAATPLPPDVTELVQQQPGPPEDAPKEPALRPETARWLIFIAFVILMLVFLVNSYLRHAKD